MKTLVLLIAGLGIGLGIHGQIPPAKKTESKTYKIKTSKDTVESPKPAILKAGKFEVTHYSILSLEPPSNKVLEKIVGSTIEVGATEFKGSKIDNQHYSITEVQLMQSGNFIYQTFGRALRAPEPNLPAQIYVHKTDNADVFGIVQLEGRQLAIPYKGVLLFLKPLL